MSHLASVVASLAARARSLDSKPDLSSAIDVLGDLARVTARGTVEEIRAAQASVVMLRENLDGEVPQNNPFDMLQEKGSHIYLAGAMWAVSECMSAQLRALQADYAARPDGRTTRRSLVTEALLHGLLGRGATSPVDLKDDERVRALHPRPDEISRALGALVSSGDLREVAPDGRADRRRKYFELTSSGTARARAAGSDSHEK